MITDTWNQIHRIIEKSNSVIFDADFLISLIENENNMNDSVIELIHLLYMKDRIIFAPITAQKILSNKKQTFPNCDKNELRNLTTNLLNNEFNHSTVVSRKQLSHTRMHVGQVKDKESKFICLYALAVSFQNKFANVAQLQSKQISLFIQKKKIALDIQRCFIKYDENPPPIPVVMYNITNGKIEEGFDV